jgi:cell filamentation protein
MNKDKVLSGDDDHFEPGSNQLVLRNKLGIVSPTIMNLTETGELVHAEWASYELVEDSTKFSIELIRQLHLIWLGPIYDFAGEYRNVNVSKGSVMFCPAWNIPDQMLRFEAEFLNEFTPCSQLDIQTLCSRVAMIHAEFLLIHPFREGNGRLARWIANLMIMQSGFPPPDYQSLNLSDESVRQKYFGALRKGYYDQNTEDLSLLFQTWVLGAQPKS